MRKREKKTLKIMVKTMSNKKIFFFQFSRISFFKDGHLRMWTLCFLGQ